MRSDLYPKAFKLVIPCRNCGDYIAQCLSSLQDQSLTDWTALVADDASSDDTAKMVKPFLADPRIKLRTAPERLHLMGNTVSALNSLDIRPDDVLAIVDGDDHLQPACLEKVWEQHRQGFDLVYTDEDIGGKSHSIGRAPLKGIPVREQLWCFSKLRSFKGYLYTLLDDETFRDEKGEYFRAAGDLSICLPLAELAGPGKIRFIDEKLYNYRVHDQCNFKVMRDEQLDNNWFIRSRPRLSPQTAHFDFTLEVDDIDKGDLFALGEKYEKVISAPHTVRLEHPIQEDERDSWRAYHGLWLADRVFLAEKIVEPAWNK